MTHNTPLEQLSAAIGDILSEYAGDIGQNVGQIAEQMGKKGVQALRKQSKAALNTDTGDYAKGWKSQVEQTRTGTTVTIYNTHPGLPHLLEHGHVTRNSTGRVFPKTPAHEHIAPVAQELVETFQREVVEKL